jgi:hypothetical protein
VLNSVSSSFSIVLKIDQILAPGLSITDYGWQLHLALRKRTSNNLLSVLATQTPNTAFARAIQEAFGGVPHLTGGFRIGNPAAKRATPTSR